MIENNTAIATVYARAKGIERAIAQIPSNGAVRSSIGKDISSCARMLAEATGEDYSCLVIEERYYYRTPPWGWIVSRQLAESKLLQLINILEQVYHYGEPGIEAGAAYNFIKDTILKSRCSDLLSLEDNFDRVINQATQVFEDRIREISGLGSLTGDALICKAIGHDPTSIIRFSVDNNEHSGYFFICKGIVAAFRNKTHHRIIDTITREEALKFCGFIDTILGVLNSCEIVKGEQTL
uniref:TIGR02391 family protein n=1 Tax=uncultured Bilophila sp. TaxID=529385 RepID=UPI0025FE2057|nr:TIGR02391 family protein [uncultured Bilophila sp.]